MTSSPAPMPRASSAMTIASVPFATPIVAGTPRYAAASCSNARTFGPRMNSPESRTPPMAASSSGISGAYCALTSTRGVGGTAARQSSRAQPAPDQDGGGENDQRDDDVVDVLE